MISGEQIRAARKLLGWRQAELAKQARIPAHSVESAESSVDQSFVPGQDMQAMRRPRSGWSRVHERRRARGEAQGEGAEGQVITGARILAARKLLCWPRDRLAPKAGISLTMLKRIEEGAYVPSIEEHSALRAALEEGGVEFTNRDQPGVKLRKEAEGAKGEVI